MPSDAALPFSAPGLSAGDRRALQALYAAGTPETTQRAYASDLAYLSAWKGLAFGRPLAWPEAEAVALRFVLDHARNLETAAADDPARIVAEALVASGQRRGLACPAPATLDRRIAAWRAFHRMQNLVSPFDGPLLRDARAKARRAAARVPQPKSAHPITRDVLERLEAACGYDLRGTRDRAILLLGWASGGRRRSEIVSLDAEDIDMEAFDTETLLRIRLYSTKTTQPGRTPQLVLKGRAARAVVAWTEAAGIDGGPLFRRVTRSGTVGHKRLSADAVGRIVKRLLEAAGLGAGYASAHGLRSGFLTQAALDGAPLPAAMRLSLHRSPAQAQRYYDDADLARNPAADLLEPRSRLRPAAEDGRVAPDHRDE